MGSLNEDRDALHVRGATRTVLLALAAALIALAAPSVAAAAPFQVNTTADPAEDKVCSAPPGDCTLREAVSLAGSADTINVPSGTYTLALGELSLVSDHIVGAGARTTIINGNNASRVFRVSGETSSSIAGVTIRGGNGASSVISSGTGGAVYVGVGAVLSIGSSTVTANTAVNGGGIHTAGTLGLVTSTVSGNTASGRSPRGGGINVASGAGAALVNATISGNTAAATVGASLGGGIASSGGLSFNGVTIANNTATSAGGFYEDAVGAAAPPPRTIANTIVSGNSGTECGGAGLDTDTTRNSVSDDATCAFTGTGDRQGFSAQLIALANNGGTTNTHALLPASPAINNGSACAATDQRGVARPQPAGGQCDVGAYEYRAPTLTAITNVVNDAGGTRTPDQFSVHVRQGGTDVKGSPAAGSAAGTPYTLDAGSTYAVGADAVTGYTQAVTGACAANGSITLQEGQAATCTITASDTAPTLRVITQVVNDDGGSLTPAGVTARVTGTATNLSAPGSATGTLYPLVAARQYTVSADAVTGYTRTVSGGCAANGTITLQLAQNLSCTITLNDIAPTLRVIMAVRNDDGGSAELDDFSVHVRKGGAEVAGSPQPGSANGTEYTLTAGAHAVAADGVPGYSISVTGDCAANGTITLQLAQARTCTLTADDGAPALKVISAVVNDDGGTAAASAFNVHVKSAGTDVVGSPQPGSVAGTTYSLVAGAYAVSSSGVSGYATSFSGDCGSGGAVTLAVGEPEKTCTVTSNDIAPTLKVITSVVNDNGGTRAPSGFTIHVRKGGAEVAGSPKPGSASGSTYTLDAGSYAVAADAVSGYTTAMSGSCTAGGAVTLQPGQNRTCTVTANDTPRTTNQGRQLPPPQLGRNVNAVPKSGTVKVKLPGTDTFVPIDEAEQIPVGTIVDVTKGRVTLTAAANNSGGTATADFYGGIFKLSQSKGAKPITTLTLVEKLSCPRSGKASAAAKRKKKRRLWGDGKGRFRTKGKHSAATVLGTKWLVEDRCTSTLTRVVRGKVSVRDFARRKTVVVRAGKKYVAKAKR